MTSASWDSDRAKLLLFPNRGTFIADSISDPRDPCRPNTKLCTGTEMSNVSTQRERMNGQKGLLVLLLTTIAVPSSSSYARSLFLIFFLLRNCR